MIDLQIKDIEFPGVVKYESSYYYAIGILADWILDYRSYDPEYDPAEWSKKSARDDYPVISPVMGRTFLESIGLRKFGTDVIPGFLSANGSDRAFPLFFVNFDDSEYISSYHDLPLEDYAGKGWTSSYGDFFDALPDSIKKYWIEE